MRKNGWLTPEQINERKHKTTEPTPPHIKVTCDWDFKSGYPMHYTCKTHNLDFETYPQLRDHMNKVVAVAPDASSSIV